MGERIEGGEGRIGDIGQRPVRQGNHSTGVGDGIGGGEEEAKRKMEVFAKGNKEATLPSLKGRSKPIMRGV